MANHLICSVFIWAVIGSPVVGTDVEPPSPSNDDFTSAESLKKCTPLGKVKIYIKNKDGSFSHLDRIPWDLLCAFADPGDGGCVMNKETGKLEPVLDEHKNMMLNDVGMYGIGSRTSTTFMRLIAFRTKKNHSDEAEASVTHACHGTVHEDSIPDKEPWLALIQRGECYFSEKLENAVDTHGAKGFVMYTSADKAVVVMNISTPDLTTIMINYTNGYNIEQLDALLMMLPYLPNMTTDALPYTDQLYANVSFDLCKKHPPTSGPKTTPLPVTIVTITFVVVMIVALAWLVVYYLQKHRNANKQAILRVKLQKAAKKALKKIGERVIRDSDKEANSQDDCTYCLEPLQVGETIRELPCRHKFHKDCVDSWLIHNQTCPNCHGNILVAMGVTIRGLRTSTDADSEGTGTEMLDMASDNGRRQLLSASGAIAGYREGQQFGSPMIPGSQLLTDGQTMFLFVPNDVELPSDTTIHIDNPPPHLLMDPVLTASQQLNEPQELQQADAEEGQKLLSNAL